MIYRAFPVGSDFKFLLMINLSLLNSHNSLSCCLLVWLVIFILSFCSSEASVVYSVPNQRILDDAAQNWIVKSNIRFVCVWKTNHASETHNGILGIPMKQFETRIRGSLQSQVVSRISFVTGIVFLVGRQHYVRFFFFLVSVSLMPIWLKIRKWT
jgi:hypothetical protein